MKGILKIYHPDETLKYSIKSTYCKALYANDQYTLELEIITNDELDNVEDDSLQYHFPQLALSISDFPITSSEIAGQSLQINDNEENIYTDVNLFSDDEAYLYDNELTFSENTNGDLELVWKGQIDDFYTNNDEPIAFKLKCHFKENETIETED
ncbi:MAG: hypothetical protein Q4C75_02035 [Bergeyella zoohelcum]|nr:hypothetical protein [Bergeyella zoohelcum]